MKLYVCYGTWTALGHPCGRAHKALEDAGHKPDVVRALGSKNLPGIFNFTPARREVKRLTGEYDVPVLVLGDGKVVAGNKKIVEWAEAHPA